MNDRHLNILFTSAGRRVGLLQAFQQALADSGVSGNVLAGDLDPAAATSLLADRSYQLPPVSSPSYVTELKEICRRDSIGLVVPLIDPELEVLAAVRDDFLSFGSQIMVSTPGSIAHVRDKLRTAELFTRVGLPTPRTEEVSPASVDSEELVRRLGIPLVLKPRHGSSGEGIHFCFTREELERDLRRLSGSYLAQELVEGTEVTIDLFGDGEGSVLSLVPRKRLKVRGGEVERGVTVPDSLFRQDMQVLARALKPFGAINVQCIVDEDGPKYTEINGRFGGGYPLAHAAGAAFPELLIELVLGRRPAARLGSYTVGLLMARYDEAVFRNAGDFPDADSLLSLGANLGEGRN